MIARRRRVRYLPASYYRGASYVIRVPKPLQLPGFLHRMLGRVTRKGRQ